MPTTAFKEQERVFANSDGSIFFCFYKAQTVDPNSLYIQVALTTADNKVLILDRNQTNVFASVEDDGTHFYFVIDGVNQALPTGTFRFDAQINEELKTYYITSRDNPFTLGQHSAYHVDTKGYPIQYVMRAYQPLEGGLSSLYVPFPREFSVAPDMVLAQVLDSNSTPIGYVRVSSINTHGFTASFNPVSVVNTTLSYVLWTAATPVSLGVLNPSLGPFWSSDDVIVQ